MLSLNWFFSGRQNAEVIVNTWIPSSLINTTRWTRWNVQLEQSIEWIKMKWTSEKIEEWMKSFKVWPLTSALRHEKRPAGVCRLIASLVAAGTHICSHRKTPTCYVFFHRQMFKNTNSTYSDKIQLQACLKIYSHPLIYTGVLDVELERKRGVFVTLSDTGFSGILHQQNPLKHF